MKKVLLGILTIFLCDLVPDFALFFHRPDREPGAGSASSSEDRLTHFKDRLQGLAAR